MPPTQRLGEEGLVWPVCVFRLLPETYLWVLRSQTTQTRGKEMRFMRRIIVKVMLVSLVAVAVAVAAWVTVTPQQAKAEFPGHNGRIAFMKLDSAGLYQIWVANQDLSAQVKL